MKQEILEGKHHKKLTTDPARVIYDFVKDGSKPESSGEWEKEILVYLYPTTFVEDLVTTVKLDESRKQALDRFLAFLIVEGGVKVSLQEILGLMVDYSLENRDKLVKRIKKLPPLEDDPAWKMLKEPDDWGVTDASEKIDEYLYGERHGSVR